MTNKIFRILKLCSYENSNKANIKIENKPL